MDTIDITKACARLSGAVQLKTFSSKNMDEIEKAPFLALHQHLRESYPLIHQHLEVEVVNELSLLYRWKGQSSAEPIIFLSHLDVVPVSPATEGQWHYPAFGGQIAEGYIWGRGTLDMKGHLIALMESVEHLLCTGFTPPYDIYLALGHDEEPMGNNGAAAIVRLLEERGVYANYVLDEGGLVLNGAEFGVPHRIAAVGIAEKHILELHLTANSLGGHAAMPPDRTAVGTLCTAIAAIERHKFPMVYNPTAKLLFETLKPHMGFVNRMVLSNMWLFKGLFFRIIGKNPKGAALFRTTVAPTMLAGSEAPNVLASQAKVVLNIRALPGVPVAHVVERLQTLAGQDIHIEVFFDGGESKVSSVESKAWKTIHSAVQQNLGQDIIVAPYLMTATTDSRLYQRIAKDVYRFDPFPSAGQDLASIHGVNERLSLDSLERGIRFFIQVIKES